MTDANPWEIVAFDAKEAMREGHEQPIAIYLEAASAIIKLLAALMDDDTTPETSWRLRLVPIGEQPPIAPHNPSERIYEEDWEGDPDQLRKAIARGNSQAVGWYLRDLGEVLKGLARCLSPTTQAQDWRLMFRQARRGRRRDAATEDLHSLIRLRLWLGKQRGIKQEATITELMHEFRVSRATIMRSKRRTKSGLTKKRN